MKIEWVPIRKIMTNKQRLYVVQNKEMVCLHKHYFSKQSKQFRGYMEVAHGQTWFYGNVHKHAILLEDTIVQSEDDEFWDKRVSVMAEVYELRLRGIQHLVGESDKPYVTEIIRNMVDVIILLPNGDLVTCNRTNPSGADATTENNCIVRALFEAYIQVLYWETIPHNPAKPYASDRAIREEKKGTKYLGDDRIASSRDYPEGYLDFYSTHIQQCGVKVKTLTTTSGPVGAEFAGYTIHFDKRINMYVPHYKREKIFAGLFVTHDENINITCSRMMAFAFLCWPQEDLYYELKPLIIKYLQPHKHLDLAQAAIHFWLDYEYMKYAWTGLESLPYVLQAAVEGYCLKDGQFTCLAQSALDH